MKPLGHTPGRCVTLDVKQLDTGALVTLEKVGMTEENHRRLRQANQRLTAGDLKADLDQFAGILRDRWAYFKAGDVDFAALCNAARKAAAADTTMGELAIVLQSIIAPGIDGHAGVSSVDHGDGGHLPVLLEPAGDRFVGFRPDRSGFIADEFPFVDKIDGKPVQKWLDATAAEVVAGAPQYRVRHGLRELRHLDYWREHVGIPRRPAVVVELSGEDGETTLTVELPVARSRPIYGDWPREGAVRSPSLIDGNVGCLRITRMTPECRQLINGAMKRFRDAAGVIIDVRGNGGGTRDALLALLPYTMRAADSPRIANVAAYRLHAGFPRDHLESRFVYRADSPRWTEAERAAIAVFAKTFSPQWAPPNREFSEWHYLVIRRKPNDGAFHYERPIVVLMDAKCFSGTDIFLGALKGRPNVTLMGTPSGGGSGRRVDYHLDRSGIRVTLASMASFQPDGQLYDGNGVTPDVIVEPTPEYFLKNGEDNVLAAAVAHIRLKRYDLPDKKK